MRNVVFAHGKPPKERYDNPDLPKPHEANWFPWIKDQLEAEGIEVDIPALPAPYYPVYKDLGAVLLSSRIQSDTALVGFSMGAELWQHLLSENEQLTPEHLVLVAPWRDIDGKYGDFSKYTLDPQIGERVGRLTVIVSLDDSERIQSNAQDIITAIPQANLIELNGYGHFMIGNNMTGPEFPELLTVLLDK